MTLPVTDDPQSQRDSILGAITVDAVGKQQVGRIAMIAGKLDKVISRQMRLNRWEAPLVTLALEQLVLAYCSAMYEREMELEAAALAEEIPDAT